MIEEAEDLLAEIEDERERKTAMGFNSVTEDQSKSPADAVKDAEEDAVEERPEMVTAAQSTGGVMPDTAATNHHLI